MYTYTCDVLTLVCLKKLAFYLKTMKGVKSTSTTLTRILYFICEYL